MMKLLEVIEIMLPDEKVDEKNIVGMYDSIR